MGSNPAQGNYSFPQKLSSVEFPVSFSQFLLNLDCESICDPPGGDALLAQGIYLTDYIYIYIYIYIKLLWKTRTDNFERRKIYTVKILKLIKNLIKNVSVCDLHQLQCK